MQGDGASLVKNSSISLGLIRSATAEERSGSLSLARVREAPLCRNSGAARSVSLGSVSIVGGVVVSR